MDREENHMIPQNLHIPRKQIDQTSNGKHIVSISPYKGLALKGLIFIGSGIFSSNALNLGGIKAFTAAVEEKRIRAMNETFVFIFMDRSIHLVYYKTAEKSYKHS